MLMLGLTGGFGFVFLAGLWLLMPRLLKENVTYQYRRQEENDLHRPQKARAARA